jgi:hypothetical protein
MIMQPTSTHSVSINLDSHNGQLYDSKLMDHLIEGELSPDLQEERKAIFKAMQPLMTFLEHRWKTTVALTSDEMGYSEVQIFTHATSVAKEVFIHVFHGNVVHPDIQYYAAEAEDMLETMDRYVAKHGHGHTEGLTAVYPEAMRSLLKHYDERCKIKHSANRLTHSFVITPGPLSKNTMGVRITLSSRTPVESTSERPTLQ